ncbi:MAG: NAD(P)H-binding protein [Chloroflexota bacterium]
MSIILVTGGTGFIGQALVRQLLSDGREVRTLIRPSQKSPNLPAGLPIKAAISSITDERNLRAAMVSVDTIYHLVGGEWLGLHGDLQEIEIEGTRTLIRAAQDANIKRIFYVSHLGADRGSAYPLMKAKAIAEQHIRRSGIPYTIIRSGLVYGPGDHFTTSILKLLKTFPFYFPLPGIGSAVTQPVWIGDMIAALIWSLDNPDSLNRVYEIGGPEYLTILEIVTEIMQQAGLRRGFLHVRPSYMRMISVYLEYFFPRLPVSAHWLDYFAMNRTCDIDSLPREFGLLPEYFSRKIDYLAPDKSKGKHKK